MRTRLLFVARPAEGGIRQHVLGILDNLDANRYEATIGAPADFLRSLPEALAADREIVPIAPRFSPGLDIAAARRINRLAAHRNLVHAHGLRAAWIASLAHLSRSFPLIATAHNLVETRSSIMRFGLSLIGKRALRIIAVSQAISDGLIAGGIPRAKVVIIPNGVDVEHFAQLPPRFIARREVGAAEEAFVVGCIARLSEEKGVDVLLAAAEMLPAATFIVAGDGPYRSRLEKSAPGNVRFLGRVADTRNVLAASDIVAIPSRLEGQGIAALEAMAAKVPIVASRVGGLAEMLTDRDTALLVPPGDTGALAKAVKLMRDDADLRQSLADHAVLLVRERYSLSQMIESLESLYAEFAAS